MTITKYLLLDSRDQKFPNTPTNDCFFYFQYGGIKAAKSIELLTFSLPMTFYNVNENNNKIYFNDGTDKIATLTPGNYDITDFLAELKTEMDSVSTITFTPTYSNISMKITITGDSAFTLTFGTNTTNSSSKILGFPDVDTSSSVTQVGTNTINLSVPLYINICIDGFSSSIKSSNHFDNATFCCHTFGNGSDVFTWNSSNSYEQIIPCTDDNIQSIHVIIKDYNNQLLELNGGNWSMLLKINYVDI